MKTITSVWDDSARHRSVKFVVRYRRDHEGAEVLGFEPTEISFRCKTMRTELRSVRVHTPKGRCRLADQIRRSGRLRELVREIQLGDLPASTV